MEMDSQQYLMDFDIGLFGGESKAPTGSAAVKDAATPAMPEVKRSPASFECSVCLELLDSASFTSVPSGRRMRLGDEGLTDIVTTSCGHMYHLVCLMKWFREHGNRTCPTCRKNVPSKKLIRLYPNVTDATRPVSPLGEGRCTHAECQGLRDIHNALMKDYDDLQSRYNHLKGKKQFQINCRIRALLKDNRRKEIEIERLQRELSLLREMLN